MDYTIPFKVRIYSDGSFKNNKGAWAWTVKDYSTDVTLIIGAEVQYGIKNSFQAEVMGIIKGLNSVPAYRVVEICTDQECIVNAFETGSQYKYATQEHWVDKKSKQYLGPLWRELVRAAERHVTTFRWVARSSWAGMRECDKLAGIFLEKRAGSRLLDASSND